MLLFTFATSSILLQTLIPVCLAGMRGARASLLREEDYLRVERNFFLEREIDAAAKAA